MVKKLISYHLKMGGIVKLLLTRSFTIKLTARILKSIEGQNEDREMKQITRDDFNKIFMQPGIFCKETGFEGRNDIALYYDMLNRTVDYSELNAIKKNTI